MANRRLKDCRVDKSFDYEDSFLAKIGKRIANGWQMDSKRMSKDKLPNFALLLSFRPTLFDLIQIQR